MPYIHLKKYPTGTISFKCLKKLCAWFFLPIILVWRNGLYMVRLQATYSTQNQDNPTDSCFLHQEYLTHRTKRTPFSFLVTKNLGLEMTNLPLRNDGQNCPCLHNRWQRKFAPLSFHSTAGNAGCLAMVIVLLVVEPLI